MSLELTRRGLLSLIPAALLAPKMATPLPPSNPVRLERFVFAMVNPGISPSIHCERQYRLRKVFANGSHGGRLIFKVLRNGEPMIGDIIERDDLISVNVSDMTYIYPRPASIVLTVA